MFKDEQRKNRELEDFRYDAKLFQQAYRAGLKAKKREEDLRQSRYIKIALGIIFTIIFIFVSIWIITRLPTKYTYVQAISSPKESVFNNLHIENNPGIILQEEVIDNDFVNAKAALYADLKTGQIFYNKNIDEVFPIASITKLMTAIVVLDNLNLEKDIEVTENWFEREEIEWSVGFEKGDIISVKDLLHIAMVSSHNDTTYILANHFEGGLNGFVKEMNDYALLLGMDNTMFFNPSGLDSEINNVSTVRDLYLLSVAVHNNTILMNMLKDFSVDVEWNNGSERVFTTNAILNQYGNIGGKTGYTKEAGPCFLGFTDNNKVTIVLNSSSRFDDTKKLLEIDL